MLTGTSVYIILNVNKNLYMIYKSRSYRNDCTDTKNCVPRSMCIRIYLHFTDPLSHMVQNMSQHKEAYNTTQICNMWFVQLFFII